MARRKRSDVPKLKKLVAALKAYRLEKGLSQMALAKAVGAAFVTMNRWLSGHRLPDELHAYRIKKLLEKKGEKE